MGERYLAVAFAAERKRKKGTQIARTCLGSIDGEQSSKNIPLQMEQSPVCLNIKFPGALLLPTESTLLVKHPMCCWECKAIFNLQVILFYFLFDPSYIVFISVGLSFFTENQTSRESDLLRAWEYVYQGSVSLSNRMQVGFLRTSLFVFLSLLIDLLQRNWLTIHLEYFRSKC